MDEFPSTYVSYHVRGMRGFALEEFYNPLRDGMRGGDPAVDVIDVDGEKCVVNCKHVSIMYMTTEGGRERHQKFEALLKEEEDEAERGY